MPTGNVTTTHVSGGMVFSDVIPDRVHGKVGTAETGDPNKVYKIANYNQAKDIFGKGQLVDSLKQYFEEFDESIGQVPVPVLCVRPANDTLGSIGTPTLNRTSGNKATASTAGTPTGKRTVKLKFTKGGACGTAEYRKSIDGGITYGSPLVTPASTESISLDVGVTISFTDYTTPSESFQVGDEWTIDIVSPGASNVARLEAIEVFKREYSTYFLHVLGESTRAFAVSVDSLLKEFEEVHHPLFAILEARTIGTGEDVSDYYQSLMDEFDPFFSDRISIVCSEGKYISGGVKNAGGFEIVKSNTNLGEWRNAGTMLSAKVAAGAPNVSAAYVALNQSLTFSEIRHWKDGYLDYMDSMHDMRLLVLKEYDDKEGIYIAKDRIKSHPDSDFVEIPERRRVDKMHRIVYRETLPFLNMDSEIKSGSGGLDFIKATCDAKIASEMKQPNRAEISDHKIIFDPDKSFARTRILKAKLQIMVPGRVNAIEWETSFKGI